MTGELEQAIGAVVLHKDDDVAVLIRPAQAGEALAAGGAQGKLTLHPTTTVPHGHKIALRALAAGTEIRKYGEVIGRLTVAIAAGDHVHIHNLTSLRGL